MTTPVNPRERRNLRLALALGALAVVLYCGFIALRLLGGRA